MNSNYNDLFFMDFSKKNREKLEKLRKSHPNKICLPIVADPVGRPIYPKFIVDKKTNKYVVDRDYAKATLIL